MKYTHSKNIEPSISNHASFFQKESNNSFFANTNGPFFTPSSVQPKWTANQPGDSYEKETDEITNKAIQPFAHTSTSIIRKKCASCEQEEETKVQTKPENNFLQKTSPVIENNLTSSKGSGDPLPANTREQIENTFGVNFSDVRLHTDSPAVQMGKVLKAQAFTHSSGIYFKGRKYNSDNREVKTLLTQELTHVVQQAGGTTSLQRLLENKHDLTATQLSGDWILKKSLPSHHPFIAGTGSRRSEYQSRK